MKNKNLAISILEKAHYISMIGLALILSLMLFKHTFSLVAEIVGTTDHEIANLAADMLGITSAETPEIVLSAQIEQDIEGIKKEQHPDCDTMTPSDCAYESYYYRMDKLAKLHPSVKIH